MLKELTSVKTLAWPEIDSWLNELADQIRMSLNLKNASIIITSIKDVVPAAILASKLGLSFNDSLAVGNKIHFSIIASKVVKASVKAHLTVSFYETTSDNQYETLPGCDISIEQINIPFGEQMFALSFPWDKR